MLLHLRRDGDALARQDVDDPVGGPGALGNVMDARQRLQRHGGRRAVGQVAAEIMPVAAHGERCGADRAAEVEGENLIVRIAPELQRHQRQQHRLAGAGRADHQGMADIADMERKPERGRALGLAKEQRRRTEMLVSFRARPDRRERDHVGEIERARPAAGGHWRRHGRAATPSQASTALTRLRHAGEVAALDDLLDQAQLLVGDAWDRRPRP